MASSALARADPSSLASESERPRARHRSDIQGLRAIAVTAVIAYHVDGRLPGGFLGVDTFFVLSGYVVTASVMARIESDGRFSALEFLGRRVRRLLPALAIMIVGTLLIGTVVLSPIGQGQAMTGTARAAALSIANFDLYGRFGYFAPAAEQNPLLHTWSLSIEEQFYLGFAVAVALLTRAFGYRRSVVCVFAAGTIVVSAALALRWNGGTDVDGLLDSRRFAFYAPYSRGFEFGAGVLLATLPQLHLRRSASSSGVVGTLGLVVLISSYFILDESTRVPGWWLAWPIVATLVVLSADGAGPTGRLLAANPMVWVGDRSYGLYLWHWPLLVFAGRLADWLWPVAVLAAVALADLSYRLVEDPIRHTWRPGRPTVVLGAACIVVPLLLSSLLSVAIDRGLGIPDASGLSERTGARDRGCHSEIGVPAASAEDCTWATDQGEKTMWLVGDSHAVTIADMAIEVGNDLGYDVTIQTRSICPFHGRNVERRGCAEYQRDTLASLRRGRVDVVVVANRSPIYVPPDDSSSGFPVVDRNDDVASSQRLAAAAWDEGWIELIDELRSTVDRVIIIETVPEFDESPSASVSLLRPGGARPEVTLSELRDRRALTADVHARLAQEYPFVDVIDPAPLLCEASCLQKRDGIWLYYDDDHLSVAGADRIGPALRESLRSDDGSR